MLDAVSPAFAEDDGRRHLDRPRRRGASARAQQPARGRIAVGRRQDTASKIDGYVVVRQRCRDEAQRAVVAFRGKPPYVPATTP